MCVMIGGPERPFPFPAKEALKNPDCCPFCGNKHPKAGGFLATFDEYINCPGCQSKYNFASGMWERKCPKCGRDVPVNGSMHPEALCDHHDELYGENICFRYIPRPGIPVEETE